MLLVMAVLMSVFVTGCTSTPSTAADESAEAALKERAVAILEARWNALLPNTNDLAQFYEMTLPEAAADWERVEAQVEEHYRESAAQAGFEYTSVKVMPEFTKVEITGDTAKVDALVSVEYTSRYLGSAEEILTQESDIPFSLDLVKRGDTWYLVKLESQDTFSKQGDEHTARILQVTSVLGSRDGLRPGEAGL